MSTTVQHGGSTWENSTARSPSSRGPAPGWEGRSPRLFAQEGASVVAIARRTEKLQGVIDGITARGGRAIAVVGDVSKEEEVQNPVGTAVEQSGRLDIVASNADLMGRMAPVGDLDDETWDRVIDVNLTGPMCMMRAAILVYLGQGGGVFVTIASLGGLFGARAGAAYTAPKHGVIGLARNVAYMYARKGVRSNGIAPGGVATEIAAGIEFDPGGAGIAMSGLNLNPRNGEPDEIARVAIFLASDDASFVNGATIVADAGWSAY